MAHIPREGPLLVIVNHYNGPGIWVGLGTGLVIRVLGDVRAGIPIRQIAVAAYENFRPFGWLPVPDRLTRFAFARFYHVYGAMPMPRKEEPAIVRGLALRRILSALKAGATVVMFPEGGNVSDFVMQPIRPGVGEFLRLVARAGVPIAPAAIFEEDERFTVAFGSPIDVTSAASGDAVEDLAGTAIASLLPERLRGPYQRDLAV